MSDQQRRRLALGQRIASYRSMAPSPATLAFQASVLLAFIITLLSLSPWFVPLPIVLGLVWIWRLYQRAESVELYQHGFVVCGRRRTRSVMFNQIYEVYQSPWRRRWGRGAHEPRRWVYRVVQRNGKSIRLEHFESIRGLGMRIQQQVASRQLPIAQDAFRAGYVVRFGHHLSVSSDGLHIGRKLIAWDEIGEIEINESRDLRVLRYDDLRVIGRVACGRIANLSVLDGVLQQSQAELAPEDALSPSNEIVDEDQFSTALMDGDNLLLDEFDWEDLSDLQAGRVTMDELLRRGPHHRPRRPR